MTAGPGLPLDLQDSLTTLQAVLNVACGIPGSTAAPANGSFVFPQVGADGVALPNGDMPGNELAKLTYDVISIVGLGNDEARNTYDPDAVIEGDEYEPDPDDPEARLGGVIQSIHGNRLITVQVKCEQQAPNAAGAFTYIERVRTRMVLPSVSEALEAKGLAVADMTAARPASYVDNNGRTVAVVYFEIVFNAADSASDDPVTTIETADKPEQLP